MANTKPKKPRFSQVPPDAVIMDIPHGEDEDDFDDLDLFAAIAHNAVAWQRHLRATGQPNVLDPLD